MHVAFIRILQISKKAKRTQPWLAKGRIDLDQQRPPLRSIKLARHFKVDLAQCRKARIAQSFLSKGAFDAAYRENRRAVAVHYGSCPFQY
jgi:hypothetical protein